MKNANEKPLILDKKSALAKAKHWCAFQERSQQEVRNRLYDWGLHTTDVEELIAQLINDNFLNEERFAMAYVSGKFNIKKWGRHKIKQGLKLKYVPEKLINKALNSIDGQQYEDHLLQLAHKKAVLLKEKDGFKRRLKLAAYLQSKGYENDLILLTLKNNQL